MRLPQLRSSSSASFSSKTVFASTAALVSACVLSAALWSPVAHAMTDAQFEPAQTVFLKAADGDKSAVEGAADAFAALLKAEPANPVLMVYSGAATSMKATTTFLPWKMLAHAAEHGIAVQRYNLGQGRFAVNEVGVEASTKLGQLLQGDETVDVKSYHHQAIEEVAPGLVVWARSDDGTIQAVELADHPFGVAVQWHPEEDAAEDARLFAGLVDAAKEYRSVVERVETEGAHHG